MTACWYRDKFRINRFSNLRLCSAYWSLTPLYINKVFNQFYTGSVQCYFPWKDHALFMGSSKWSTYIRLCDNNVCVTFLL